jgi:DNA-binding MarR family transcriptional regulator
MDAERVARLRAAIGRLARQLNVTSTVEGLTPSQSSVLGLVALRGPLGLAELTELEGLNPTMLSRVVRKLDETGLIRRLSDPTDLRAVRVEITEAGSLVHERVRALRSQVLSQCLDQLPPATVDQLSTALPALEALAAALVNSGAGAGAGAGPVVGPAANAGSAAKANPNVGSAATAGANAGSGAGPAANAGTGTGAGTGGPVAAAP